MENNLISSFFDNFMIANDLSLGKQKIIQYSLVKLGHYQLYVNTVISLSTNNIYCSLN